MSGVREIDPARVWTLRRAGMTYRKIGALLANEAGRPVAFSVSRIGDVYAREKARRGLRAARSRPAPGLRSPGHVNAVIAAAGGGGFPVLQLRARA